MRLLPTASLENNVMVTNVLTLPLSVSQKQVIQGSENNVIVTNVLTLRLPARQMPGKSSAP